MAFVKFDDVDIFEMAQVARDSYEGKVEKADKKRKNALEKAKRTSNDVGMREAKIQADKEFEENVERARFEVRKDFIEGALRSARSKEVARVQVINEGKLAKLKLLADRKMSADEFHALASIDGYSMDYWSSQVLRDIAENSGLTVEDMPDIHILPSVTTKLRVLTEIEQETEDMLEHYDPERNLKDIAYLHRGHIQRWMDEYTNGLRTLANLPDSMIIERALNNICQCPDELTKGQAINKELRNVPDRCRAELINQIVAKNSIGDTAKRLSGYESELRDFAKNGGTLEYRTAQDAVRTVLSAEKMMDENALNAIHNMKNNRYFVSELQKSASTDIAKHYAELAEEQAAEGVAD